MTRYVLTVPYTFERNGQTETRFRRVGAIFENARRETGEVFLSVKLDFPVAVTELVGFPPRPEDDPASDEVTQSCRTSEGGRSAALLSRPPPKRGTTEVRQ